MLVVNWMSTQLIKIAPTAPTTLALRLMREYSVGRVAVVDASGKLVGIVSDRDLKKAGPSAVTPRLLFRLAMLMRRVKVADIMTPDPLTVHIHDTIDEAALIMLENNVGGLPVLDDSGQVVAMITDSDVFRAWVLLSGVTRGGIQFALDIEDAPGSIKKVTDIIRAHGGRLASIMTSYDRVGAGRRKVYIRAKALQREELLQIKEELAQVGVLLYIVDHTEHKRELISIGRYTKTA